MCLWAIYIFPGSVYIFPPAKKADPSWEYIIRSQTHECVNWDWGPDIPFLGIFVSNFRHFVFAVCFTAIVEPADRSSRYNLICCQRDYLDLFTQALLRYRRKGTDTLMRPRSSSQALAPKMSVLIVTNEWHRVMIPWSMTRTNREDCNPRPPESMPPPPLPSSPPPPDSTVSEDAGIDPSIQLRLRHWLSDRLAKWSSTTWPNPQGADPHFLHTREGR